MAQHCPECGFVNAEGANYCQRCGAFLAVPAESTREPSTATYRVGETGELIPEVWDRWLAADPVRMARAHAHALRSLRAIWLDAGRGDEYSLDLATTAFHREVLAAGVPAERIHFELFEGGHGNIAWRYPLALAWLAERLGE